VNTLWELFVAALCYVLLSSLWRALWFSCWRWLLLWAMMSLWHVKPY